VGSLPSCVYAIISMFRDLEIRPVPGHGTACLAGQATGSDQCWRRRGGSLFFFTLLLHAAARSSRMALFAIAIFVMLVMISRGKRARGLRYSPGSSFCLAGKFKSAIWFLLGPISRPSACMVCLPASLS